jgi:hypothetical protein
MALVTILVSDIILIVDLFRYFTGSVLAVDSSPTNLIHLRVVIVIGSKVEIIDPTVLFLILNGIAQLFVLAATHQVQNH